MAEAVAHAFSAGGECMIAIAAVLVVGAGLAAERFYFVFVKCNINTAAFTGQIQKLVAANNVERAIKLCNAAPTAALSRVILAGLVAAEKGDAEIGRAVRVAELEILPALAARLPALRGAAATAALLGALGAAIGLIRASAASPVVEAGGAPLHAAGLAAAMYPLAFGAAVAIALVLANAFLGCTAARIAADVALHGQRLRNLLAERASS